MASLRSVLATGLLLLSTTANAHFELHHPTPLTGDQSKQATAPCGGGNPEIDQNTATDFHVEGDYVQIFNGHAQGHWLIRATLDPKAAGDWEQLFPIVQQTGRGNFCEPAVTAPSEWVGKKGFLGIGGNAGDGILYACAAVNFVSGSAPSPGGACVNGSSVSASFQPDETLSALVGSSSDSGSTGSETTAPAPAATTSQPSAAAPMMGERLPFGGFALTGVMLLVGAALL
ncbi:hypothetical protein QBC40DRAFT_169939 [Triangularia verruculosa]|uniref:Copper acquisition factor BIM1-like domain-containing protein n=1 Tax=Triangularia verruculosa TaxID=2587418 RepID=A0AAN6XK87_9PEZI|nr:hypothetical protein QBC40DRAFT_169939 [Triangularia verruculosa]